MRKLLTLICLCLFVTSTAFSNPLSDYFVNESIGVVVLGIEDAKYLFDLTGETTETTKVTKEVISALNDKFAINLEKDVEQIGVFVVPTSEANPNLTPTNFNPNNPGYEPVFFLCGEFDSKTIVPVVKKLISTATKEAPKMDNIEIGGKKVPALFAKNNRLIFFKKNMLLFCNENAISLMQKNKLSFSKAPSFVDGLMERSKSFLLLKKPIINFISNLNIPIYGVDSIESLSGYLNQNYIFVEAGLKDEDSANSLFKNIEKFKNDFYEKQNKAYESAKSNLSTISIEKIFDEINLLYNSAKNKDIVNRLKISQKGSSIVLEQPYDKDDKVILAIGGIGMLAAAAIPNFKAARGSARQKACFSNIRVLQGAVEMYNMDNSVMMTDLDIPTLVKEKYLKSAPKGPEPECEYYSTGDLTKDGVVGCKMHGTLPEH